MQMDTGLDFCLQEFIVLEHPGGILEAWIFGTVYGADF